MKLSQLLKCYLLALLLNALPLSATAYDFKVDGLAYNINSDGKSVSVTCDTTASTNYPNLYGVVSIPSTVKYNKKTYKVTAIGDYAFNGCTGLTGVDIPETIEYIRSHSFSFCQNLTEIVIPDNVIGLGSYSFEGCIGLKKLSIGSKVSAINGVFKGCTGLTELIWNPVNCFDMGDFPKENISSLSIGPKVEVIPYNFLSGSKITSLTVPNSVISIQSCAFADCGELTDVVIGNAVSVIGSEAFSGCSKLTRLTIGESVNSIDDEAFSGCSNLAELTWNAIDCRFYNRNIPKNAINRVTIGSKVKKIPDYFLDGSLITNVILPNSVTTVGESAFAGCAELTDIVIGKTVNVIGENAFAGCVGVTKISCYPSKVPSIASNTFFEINKNVCELHVLAGCYQSYRDADYWNQFYIIIEDLEVPMVPGDVNGDENVNVSDVTTLVNMILGVVAKDEQVADINGDGKVNVSDVTALINIILGVK